MKPGSSHQTLSIIGWRERISLPEWGIERLLAKSDTGAKSSALDVTFVEQLPGDRVRFGVALSRRKRSRVRIIEADIVRRTVVRSSNGQTHDRLFVSTVLEVGDVSINVEFGLVNREHMTCRLLLGRRTLAGHFLVDSTRKHLSLKES